MFTGNVRLGLESRKQIEEALEKDQVCVSAITPWEISMLAEKGRLIFEMELGRWVRTALAKPGISLAPLDPLTAVEAGRLPGAIHGDPADRIIVATARGLDCPLLTTDKKILAYAKAGHVVAIDARL